MGAFGSCLGVGRPVRPGANPRLLASRVNVDPNPNPFGVPGLNGNRNGQIPRTRQTNGVMEGNGKALPQKLFRQSSSISSGPQNVVTKLVDIDENPVDRFNMAVNGNNPMNSQSICNNNQQQLVANGAGSNINENIANFLENFATKPDEIVELIGLFDYQARTNDDLPFLKGEHLETTVALTRAGDWWLARSKSTKMIGYVPKNHVAKLKSKSQLTCEPWYFGKIGRTQAEIGLKLSGNGDGSFIIRDSDTTANRFSLSIRHKDEVKHYRIIPYEQGGYYINKSQIFSTLHDLVDAYSSDAKGLCIKLGKPCKRWLDNPATVGLSHDTCDEWEIDRNMLEIGCELGHGQFGKVYKGVFTREGAKLNVAIKMLKPGSMDPNDFLVEAQIMKKMNHPNLVQLYAVCTRKQPVYIVTELMCNGALINYLQTSPLGSLSIQDYIHMATQIAKGMSYIERNKYVHRDLAARNILVGENNVCKIADFGLARFIKETEYEARPGARFPIKWTAPEAASYSKFTIKSDVWSFGIVLYEIITKGGTPYPNMSNAEVISRIERGYRMEIPDGCEQKLYNIMLKCWNKEPQLRPSFESLYNTLEDYFTSDEQYREALEFRIK